MKLLLKILSLEVLMLLAAASQLAAQSTAFTYEGRLAEDGVPAEGNYDLRFMVYDAASAGQGVGGVITVEDVAVSSGRFVVTLDFGGNVFTGADRWLEIAVRAGASTGDFTTLTPRQAITPTPYAIYAKRAGSVPAANVTGTIADAQLSGNVARLSANQTFAGTNSFTHPSNVFVGSFTGSGAGLSGLNAVARTGDTMTGPLHLPADGLIAGFDQFALAGGKVGIGTASPVFSLDIRSGDEPRLSLGGPAGRLGQLNRRVDRLEILSSDAITLAPGGAFEAMRLLSSGWVGIKTNNPGTELDVHGTVTALGFSGSGAGLNNLNAARVTTGTLADGQLSANVVRRNITQTFTGTNTFSHPSNRFTGTFEGRFAGEGAGLTNVNAAYLVGLIPETSLASIPAVALTGTIADARLSSNVPRLDAEQGWHGVNSFHRNVAINDRDLFLRGPQDPNHGIGWHGDGKPFAGLMPDGPVVYGWAGGVLGTTGGGARAALAWNSAGSLFVDPVGLNDGLVTAGSSLIFGQADSGEGIASKRTTGGTQYGLDFFTAYLNRMTIANNGNVGIGTTAPAAKLEVNGTVKAAAFTGDGAGLTALNGAAIQPGSITGQQLAPGAIAENLNAAGQTAVPSGGLVLTASESTALLNAGYVKIGTSSTAELWRRRENGTSPDAAHDMSAVWTGNEMILWGGRNISYGSHGWRYHPAANSWTRIDYLNAPAPRILHTAVWTGSEMLVWGGEGNNGETLGDGGRYNPTVNRWTAIPPSGAPSPRREHTAVWTGSEMVVWGGTPDGDVHHNDGASFSPQSGLWRPVSFAGAPSNRKGHTAVWTGDEMIIWGGSAGDYLNTGGRYNPVLNAWTGVATNGVPAARSRHTAVWTGNEMVLWGGYNTDEGYLNEGSRYHPASNQWRPVSLTGAPSDRGVHTAVWTGQEMIIWGGYNGVVGLGTGARYNPVTDTWAAVSSIGAPAARRSHTAVWTGREMIVSGGIGTSVFNDGGRYDPVANSWSGTGTVGAPSWRYGHTVVWTGREMIVWGGVGDGPGPDGGRYDPVANNWTPVSTVGAPIGREGHTAVWTGSEMIVWGGNYLNTGGRYNPVANSWTAVNITGAPLGRSSHTAVWTGTEMILWGGERTTTPFVLTHGGRYNPQTDSWSTVGTSGAPPARYHHVAVWTGSEMLIWGGYSDVAGNTLSDGARYNPAVNGWSPMAEGFLAGRAFATAVWTGSEMIIWGGRSHSDAFGDGMRYNPARNLWSGVTGIAAPVARALHTAVWTGSEMIVWGGNANGGGSLGDGGRYNAANDGWTPVTVNGAPSRRADHSAVWTGDEMIIWGGASYDNSLFTYAPGGRVLYLYQRP